MKTLAIDQGNTNVKWAVFDGREIVEKHHSNNLEKDKLNQLILEKNISSVIYSSTGDYSLEEVPIIEFNHETPLPIELDYNTPATLGLDRIANAVGAFSQYPNENVLAIDLGTCATYDLVSKTGKYVGGAISPGLQMRYQAMHNFTARLPLVNRLFAEAPLGKSTVESMQSGSFYGLLGEIEKFIEVYEARHTGLKVILTGGDSGYFEKVLKSNIFADLDLTLKGLNEILLYNIGKTSSNPDFSR